MSEPVIILQTTLPHSWKEFEVGSFSQSLLESGASCVQHSSVQSMYRWEGKIESSSEWAMEIKVHVSRKENVISKIQELHPYDVPQILFWQATPSDAYGEWIRKDSSTLSDQ